MKKIHIGDRVTFKVATATGCRKATRVVKTIDRAAGSLTVTYHKHPNFVVYFEEVKTIVKKGIQELDIQEQFVEALEGLHNTGLVYQHHGWFEEVETIVKKGIQK